MGLYVAFLRGMNLGNRRIRNEELRALFEGMGFDSVATFRASGNVVFGAGGRAGGLSGRIEAGLSDALGYEVPVFLRSGAEVREIAARRPFDPSLVAASGGKVQVSMLAAEPAGGSRDAALALATDEDRLAIAGRELYWLPSGGISDSDLDLDRLAVLLGPATVRTMGTVEQIAARYL